MRHDARCPEKVALCRMVSHSKGSFTGSGPVNVSQMSYSRAAGGVGADVRWREMLDLRRMPHSSHFVRRGEIFVRLLLEALPGLRSPPTMIRPKAYTKV